MMKVAATLLFFLVDTSGQSVAICINNIGSTSEGRHYLEAEFESVALATRMCGHIPLYRRCHEPICGFALVSATLAQQLHQ